MTIREATVEDTAILLRLVAAAFEEYVGVSIRLLVHTMRRSRPSAGSSRPARWRLRWLRLAGCAFYEPHDRNFIYFGRLSVLPRFRNQGIAHALLDYVERRAKDSGAAGVSLGVRLQLPHLLARYERLGYRITST